MDKLIERINQLIDYKGISVLKLETQLGYPNGIICKAIERKSNSLIKHSYAILKAFPDISEKWLLKGENQFMFLAFCRFLKKNNIKYKSYRKDKRIDIVQFECVVIFKDYQYAHCFPYIYRNLPFYTIDVTHSNNPIELYKKLLSHRLVKSIDKKPKIYKHLKLENV